MKNVKIAKVIILLLSPIVATTGCMTSFAPRITDMVPSFESATPPISDKTLRIVEVKGGEKSDPLALDPIETSKIEDVGFRDALIKTLENSRILRNIAEDQNSYYDLYVDILSQQRLRSGFISVNAHLLVNYRLIERSSNNEIWKENIYSQYNYEGGFSDGGLARASQKANEAAVKENLLQLLKKLTVFFTQAGKETSSLAAVAVDKGTSPPTVTPTASASLEIQSKVQGAQVFIDGKNMGEVPIRISNLTPGSHEIKVVKKGYEEWKQAILIQSSEKKVIEVNLNRPGLYEDYLIDKIFYFDNCAFGYDKFNHFIRFQKGGRLEGASRSGGPAAVPKSSIDFSSLNGQWLIDKNQIIIDFQMLKGFSQRRVMKVKVDMAPDRKDVFPAECESSTEYLSYGGGQQTYHWDGKTDIVNCQMREMR